jgi:hypothetical protein
LNVEEFPRALLAGEELNVVENQRVHLAELLPERVHLILPQRGDERVHERFGREHRDARAPPAQDLVAGRVDEMRLAETDPAVQEHRIEARAGLGAHRLRGAERHLLDAPTMNPSNV